MCGNSGFASCSTAFTWVLGDGPAGVPRALLAFQGSQLGLPRGWAPPEGPAQDGPTTRPRVVAGSPPPVGPAAPLVALNHMPWTPFASPSPSLKSEPEEGRARGMGTATPLRLGRAWLPRTHLLDGGVMGGGMDPVLLEQPSLGQAQGWMCLPL